MHPRLHKLLHWSFGRLMDGSCATSLVSIKSSVRAITIMGTSSTWFYGIAFILRICCKRPKQKNIPQLNIRHKLIKCRMQLLQFFSDRHVNASRPPNSKGSPETWLWYQLMQYSSTHNNTFFLMFFTFGYLTTYGINTLQWTSYIIIVEINRNPNMYTLVVICEPS